MQYLPDVSRYQRMTTEELRESFLLPDLFKEGELVLRVTDLDRAIVGGAVPTSDGISLGAPEELASEYFAERREIGILNVGNAGTITVDGTDYNVDKLDVVYVGRGTRDVVLSSNDASSPARYYLISYPAHAEYPTTLIRRDDAEVNELGSDEASNKRILRKYIHPDQVKSSQLVMGVTELQTGSVWNTMPAHTHERRTEVYLYFNLDDDNVVFHLMGTPQEIRTVVLRNEQAVLSPGWSIHSGAGTTNYTFCWAMGGENQDFGDMQWADMKDLR